MKIARGKFARFANSLLQATTEVSLSFKAVQEQDPSIEAHEGFRPLKSSMYRALSIHAICANQHYSIHQQRTSHQQSSIDSGTDLDDASGSYDQWTPVSICQTVKERMMQPVDNSLRFCSESSGDGDHFIGVPYQWMRYIHDNTQAHPSPLAHSK